MKWLLRIFLILLLSWSLGFLAFVCSLPHSPASLSEKTDAIVVLTGGAYRVDEGLSLLKEGHAGKLFISGVYKHTRLQDIQKNYSSRLLECCVVLGYEARSTKENVVEVKKWLLANDFHSIRLVTSGYHMPRSIVEFKHVIPNVKILSHPVSGQESWLKALWEKPRTLFLLLSEFNKFCLVYFQWLITEI